MPIYEFRCSDCGNDFEKLLFSRTTSVSCASCGSAEVTRRPSRFGTSGTEKRVSGGASCSGCSAGSCSSCSH